MFQHTATRRWLHPDRIKFPHPLMFQHTATRRWLPRIANTTLRDVLTFQHTATRRWLQADGDEYLDYIKVSTHSHPKVAA